MQAVVQHVEAISGQRCASGMSSLTSESGIPGTTHTPGEDSVSNAATTSTLVPVYVALPLLR